MDSTASVLRQLLGWPGIIRSLGAHDVFTALLAEQAGFETIFVGGFGVTASLLGLPDLSFITLPEMADQIRRTCARLTVPVIADADTGHGDLQHVQRTSREFEAAGAAGMILEDQVAPKRCGHFEGKQVIPAEEMVLKVRAAKRAQRDPDFVLIARTDSRETHDLEEAIRRANLYLENGADVAFIEAPRTREELETIPKQVHGPLLVNMLFGGKTPILPAPELERMGYRIVVAPIESLLVTARAFRDIAETFLREGDVLSKREAMISFDEIKRTLNVDGFLNLRNAVSSPAHGAREDPNGPTPA